MWEKLNKVTKYIWLVLVVSAFGVGLWFGSKNAPERIEYKYRESEKIQLDEKQSETKNIQTDELRNKQVKKTITNFDKTGVVISKTEIEVKDNGITKTSEAELKVSERTVFVDRQVLVEKLVEKPHLKWTIGANVGLDFSNMSPVYGGSVDYRVLGPFTVGAWVNVRQNELLVQGGGSLKISF